MIYRYRIEFFDGTDETESKNAIKEMAKKFVESLPLYKTLGIVE